ncbi:unnamed protein product, partial [Polarella glacialis]
AGSSASSTGTFKRKECWAARDVFFQCLDEGGGEVGPEAQSRCSKEWIQFQGRCLPSWVKHFMMQRNLGVGPQPPAPKG